MRVIDILMKSITSAAEHNPDAQAAPVCILWPDQDRQWEAVIPCLQIEMPGLFILGQYDPGKRIGPGIWLRCVIAGIIADTPCPPGQTPVLYLPGVSRQDLRPSKDCREELKPLVELQYRGSIWSQANYKDWTPPAFLESHRGGAGLDVAQDQASLKTLAPAFNLLLEEEIDRLKPARLDKDFFNNLLTGGDPVRNLLQWLDQAETFRSQRDQNQWQGFVETCKSRWDLDPENHSVLDAAARLAAKQGPWQSAWERYCEAPRLYPHIPGFIRQTTLPDNLFTDKTGWPQWNEKEEKKLQAEFLKFGQLLSQEARDLLLKLEHEHGKRRGQVWAQLGEAPLAGALEGLALVAQATTNPLTAGTMEDIVDGYIKKGWQADHGLIKALAAIKELTHLEAVRAVLRAIYLPWAQESAQYLQRLVETSPYPGGTIETRPKPIEPAGGECIVFVDGLRFDTAKQLAELLKKSGHQVEEKKCWSALPSVTATAKPAVTPVGHLVKGRQADNGFEPGTAAEGKSLKGGTQLKKLLENHGWQVPDKTGTGDVGGKAWCETGNIDFEGHTRGWQLARNLDNILTEIKTRLEQLITAGWPKVRVVTDHGWLLFPGGLPRIELPAALAEHKWGRCAVVKPGAQSDEKLYPWYWNREHHIALAEGVACYREGKEYAHGGLSFQECLTLELVITAAKTGQNRAGLQIESIDWKGLRCTVAAVGNYRGLRLDLRQLPGNAATGLTTKIKPLDEQGKASVAVENDDFAGKKAFIVLLEENGQLAAQAETIIGGGET